MKSPESREALAGTVERVTFHNPDSGFCVLQVRVAGRRDPVALVGTVPTVNPGEQIQASGSWENSVEHGPQFRAQKLAVAAPSTAEGMERYLGSGLIRGIGKEMARRLVRAFGEDVFDVIDRHPERLRTVEGIGPKRLKSILEGWQEQRAVRDIMVFLQSHGVGSSRAVRIYRTYGVDAVPLISENPYRLARDIRGIGFQTADEIAARIGVPRDSPERARAGLGYVLSQAVGQGHCCLPRALLLEEAERLLDIDSAILLEALTAELVEESLIEDEIDGQAHVFLPLLWRDERAIAERLLTLLEGDPPWPTIDADAAIDWAGSKLSVEPAPSQRLALERALENKVMVLTGGPGVGKTTLVNAVLAIVRAKGTRVALAAPTGRAAKRLTESTGLDARTIHRLLEIDPRSGRFKRDSENPLECQLLVVDEVSMVDVPLMASLLDAVPEQAALLLVGDVDQLPSVGPGQVLRDLIDSGQVPVTRLTEIFRQAEASRIVANAHRINRGEMPELAPPEAGRRSDFYFVEAKETEEVHRKLVEIVARRIPRSFGLDSLRDVQVLCPMNRGPLGAKALNALLQDALNPSARLAVERFGVSFRLGDKVMQVENDYDKDVFNGDLGTISSIDADEQEVTVRFDGRGVTYRFSELDELALAYATTIHKAQGSEYPAVVLLLSMQHYPMLQPNLLYTGVTRGRRLVVLLGEARALGRAVRNRAVGRRNSRLRQWLQELATAASAQ